MKIRFLGTFIIMQVKSSPYEKFCTRTRFKTEAKLPRKWRILNVRRVNKTKEKVSVQTLS